ncbi:MAG: 30S ribosome-binding factor RbfA [Holosporaceae bacterium]|jgi:ribosome-binding factor A|nr:30S ribosome-binding factor RbfA [Holosporaceae bacterium]
MHKNCRMYRVAAEIKKVLSEYLLCSPFGQEKINSVFLSITEVTVSPGLQHAKVYVTPLSKDVNKEECLEFFKKYCHLLRRRLGREIRLKFVPDISFYIDDSYEQRNQIEMLLRRL